MKAAKRADEQVAGHEPSARHLAGVTGLTRETVRRAAARRRAAPARAGGPGAPRRRPGATFGDQLEDPRSQDPDGAVFDRIDGEGLPRRLDELSERECTVVRSRYGLDGPERTLRELSAALGVSAERVRQIEQGALAKPRR